MKISVGCDHGALALKNKVVAHLQKKGHEVSAFGTYTLDSCDYPAFAEKAAKAKEGKNDTPDGLLTDPVIDIGKLAQIIASDDSFHSRVPYSFSSAIILAMRRA